MADQLTPIDRLSAALDRFRVECLPFRGREEVSSGWLAHFLMLEFGVRRVIVESHHDGMGLSTLMRPLLNPACSRRLREGVDTKRGWGCDIAVARHDDVNARTFQQRFPGWSKATDSERCRHAALHLSKEFQLLVELKLVRQSSDSIASDLLKLGAASLAVAQFAPDAPPLTTALVIIEPTNDELPASPEQFL